MQTDEKSDGRLLKHGKKNFLLQRMRDQERSEMNELLEEQHHLNHQNQQDEQYESSWD